VLRNNRLDSISKLSGHSSHGAALFFILVGGLITSVGLKPDGGQLSEEALDLHPRDKRFAAESDCFQFLVSQQFIEFCAPDPERFASFP
jgi:hypothetical protein